MPVKNYKLEQSQYARIYGVTERSIRTYQGQGLPLDEPGKAAATLTLRKVRAPGLVSPEIAKLNYAQETGATAGPSKDMVVAEVGDTLFDLDALRLKVGQLVEDHRLLGWEQMHDQLNQMVGSIDAVFRLAGCPELMARARAFSADEQTE